jgi:KaiC/GvpD/RAD55 family RecA-like ATPase
MSALRSFLKGRAQEQCATKDQRMEALAEWKRALDSLIGQLERWLREADRANVLKVEHISVTIREQRVGIYEVEGLRVWLKYRNFHIEPIARYPFRPSFLEEKGTTVRDGMITMRGAHQEYTLYRYKREGGDEWTIADEKTHQTEILDQSTFEDAVYTLLK